MNTAVSSDGTTIAYWSSGAGPPVLLVHGAMADHARWAEVSPLLEEKFTVYAIDRRGRGKSGDASEYSMELEAQDILAVLHSIDTPTTLIGHSYGAGCALEAALLTDRVERLVLYEPGILEGVRGYYSGPRIAAALDLAERQLADRQTEDAMITIFREVIEMTVQEINAVKDSPAWPQRVAAAHTVLRELRGEAEWKFDPDRFHNLTVPTLLITGSESLQLMREGTAALHDALPNSEVATLEGQGHAAITTAPGMFIERVLAFMDSQ